MPSLPRRTAPAALLLVLLFSQPPPAAAQTDAQTKEGAQAKEPVVFCDPARALSLVGQHLAEARSLENPVRRIGLMVRAAELLWASREQEARAVFAEAFELASAHFREHGDRTIPDPQTRPGREGSGLMIQLPDQRFVVIRAVARHDSAWARTLADAAGEEPKREAEKKAADAAAKRSERNPGDKLLTLAESLLAEDLAAALNVARSAFRHPVSYTFPRFLYSVAKVDRAAADAFYLEALDAYARAYPDAVLALSAYPFATHMLVGNPRGLGPAGVPPPGFAPNPALQKTFVAFLVYADAKLKSAAARQTEEGTAPDAQEVAQLFTALATLETIYGPGDPSFAARVFPLKESAGAMLTGARRQAATSAAGRPLNWNADENTAGRYERVLEEAAKIPDPERRDGHLMRGLTPLARAESAERLAAAADKISDEIVRRQFLDFVYNEKSQQALKEGRPDEAVRLAEKVEPFDQRAVLLLGVAATGLRTSDDRQRAITLLEDVIKAAQRAPDTETKARALLGAAHLYTKFDYLRALDVIGEAVKTVNRLTDPELSLPVIRRRIEGRTHGFYTANNAPGFTLENAFRELSRRDFEGAVSIARNLEDRHLRATAVMALAANCIEESAKSAKKEAPASNNRPATKKPEPQREPPKP